MLFSNVIPPENKKITFYYIYIGDPNKIEKDNLKIRVVAFKSNILKIFLSL